MAAGWLTHLATNGAGTIHDWEYAWLGPRPRPSSENVATGTFGTWHETASNIHLALMAGALDGLGYGQALGRFILEDGATLPAARGARRRDRAPSPAIRSRPPRAELLLADAASTAWPAGRITVEHRWKHASILAQASRHEVPITVHPGIGYDIIANHPVFSGAAIGRAAECDFKLFGGSLAEPGRRRRPLDRLGHHGTAGLREGPELRQQPAPPGRPSTIVRGHTIYVVDLQDGGDWDWTAGRAAQDQPRLLPQVLQELLPHGRAPCIMSSVTS